MRKVAVVGVGQTKFSGAQARTNMELFTEAALEALEGPHLKTQDIQALLVGHSMGDFEEGQQIAHSFIAENLGLPMSRLISPTAPVLLPALPLTRLLSG